MPTPQSDSPNTRSDVSGAGKSGQADVPWRKDCPHCRPIQHAKACSLFAGPIEYGSGPITLEEQLARTDPENLSRTPMSSPLFFRRMQRATGEITRNKGIAVQHPDSAYMQVRRMALTTLLGHSDPRTLLQAAALLTKMDETDRRRDEKGSEGAKPKPPEPGAPETESDAELRAAREKLKELGLD